MRLSEERISHISHLLLSGLQKAGWAAYPDEPRTLKATKQVLTHYCHLEDEVDTAVRKILQSYSRGVLEGSREWDVLYKKHFDVEMKKRWR
ncbi:MAG TPA: DUF507 family protein [Bdellovibrionota bacterium]|nr:DUF507 family protein [Bdellovibrionota bacterium]